MNKRLWIILAVLVVVAIGGLVWWRNSAPSSTSYISFLDANSLLTKQDIINAQNKAANNGKLASNFTPAGPIIPDHFVGPANSKVVVVQYEDFACSACNGFAPTANKIMSDYKDRVLFIYRNFNLGQNTSTVSESAAEAAYLLGGETAFWKMHDLIFSTQTCMEGSDKATCQNWLISLAPQVGLDTNKFKTALADFTTNGIQDKINRDKQLGINAGVSATPTWFVNGKQVTGGSDSTMRSAIDAALKAAGLPTGAKSNS